MRSTLANPTVSDGELKTLLWVFGANHNQFNSVWASETPPATTMPRADQELVAKVFLEHDSRTRCCSIDQRYLEVLRDHAAGRHLDAGQRRSGVAVPGSGARLPAAQPGRAAAAAVSLPVQGTAAGVALVAIAQRSRISSTPARRSRRSRCACSGARRSPAAAEPRSGDGPGRTLQRRWRFASASPPRRTTPPIATRTSRSRCPSGSRTAAIRASSLHRLLYPDTRVRIRQDRDAVTAAAVAADSSRLGDRTARSAARSRCSSTGPAKGVVYVGDLQLSR